MSPHRRNTDGRPNIPNFTLLSCRLGGPQANQHIPDDPGKKKTFSVLYPLKPMEAESHDWNCPSTRDSAAHRGILGPGGKFVPIRLGRDSAAHRGILGPGVWARTYRLADLRILGYGCLLEVSAYSYRPRFAAPARH